ncbi:DUF433 domain-containing protein [Noviherbaspirillum aerium]|uniref:DUF433 domain-containing protein n=1 Tax=Noviherbaspirillum aerium TaxID=2588497 RepID=UPI00124D555E|nr:DUF433 domain-containing protein [Noviherbaspirillum aerium]
MDCSKAQGLVWIDPERMGGVPCFRGTRVPVRLLFANLAAGLTVGEIVDDYPTLAKDILLAALELAGELLEAAADQPNGGAQK